MARKVRSAKGEMVDFDLLKIKEQIASAPPTTDVQARQNFVDKRLRRRVKKAQPVEQVAKQELDVDPTLPTTEDAPVEEPKLIEEVQQETVQEEKPAPKKKATKKSTQKARPSST